MAALKTQGFPMSKDSTGFDKRQGKNTVRRDKSSAEGIDKPEISGYTQDIKRAQPVDGCLPKLKSKNDRLEGS